MRFFYLFLILSSYQLAFSQENEIGNWQQFINNDKETDLIQDDTTIYCLLNYKEIKQFTSNNYHIIRKLDENFAIVSISALNFKKIRTTKRRIWIVNNLWKLNPNLDKQNKDKMQNFIVKVSNQNDFKNFLKNKSGLRTINKNNNIFIIQSSLAELKSLGIADSPFVQYIGFESLTPKHESKIAEMDLSVNQINLLHHLYPGTTGNNQTISIKDNNFDKADIDLHDKYISSPEASPFIDAHATAMATIAAGWGNSSIKGKGVAYECKISASDYSNIFPDSPEQLTTLNVFTQNHSYGTEIENFYGAVAEAYDQACYSNPNLLHVFSAGNAGEMIPDNGNYKGLGKYANLTGNFKMSKNTLSIGSVNYNDEIMNFSSKGPAFDGRIKPELLAFSYNGTSNSTALISGLSILLQQEYQIINGGNASSALIKACLINSARDVGTAGPDFSSGFGKVDAFQSISTIKKNNFILGQVANSESKTYQIYIPPDAADLKITLVWTDPPAPINSNITLVNDLDLKLIAPDASVWEPWVLDHSATIEAITAPAKRGEDHLNNVEQITIANPISGDYTIEIKGFDVTSANQHFALVYQWKNTNSFRWTYPTASDAISTGQNPVIRLQWDNTYITDTGELSASFDQGLSWQIIDNQADLTSNYYEWKPDELKNGITLLKMNIKNQEYLSDTFVIAKETNLTVALDCEEIIELNWNENKNASSYKIYNFEQNKMLPFAETDQPFYAINKAEFDTSLFAVQAVFNNGSLSQRSETINYTTFGANCYFNSFYAQNISDDINQGIEIYLETGSVFQLNRVEIYRIKKNEAELITSFVLPSENNFIYLDPDPMQGINCYQAKIVLNDGTDYYSEIIEVPFLREQAFLIFPNPTNNSGINIISKNFQEQIITFKLYDADGAEILSSPLHSNFEHIDLQSVRSGVYFYKLESSQGSIQSSKLIIQ